MKHQTFPRWLFILMCVLAGCDRDKKEPAPVSAPPTALSQNSQVQQRFQTTGTDQQAPVPPSAATPVTLLELDTSAYGSTLLIDGDFIYFFSDLESWRFSLSGAATKLAVNPGRDAALVENGIVYFRDGALQTLPRDGGRSGETERIAAKIDAPPLEFIPGENHAVWLNRDAESRFVFWTLTGGKNRKVHTASGAVLSPLIWNKRIYFIETISGGIWRINGIPLKPGAEALSSTPRTTRPPSMITASGEHLYYYDLPSRSVRRVSGDLTDEHTVAQQVICSPIAVSNRIVCARVEGIFETSLNGSSSRQLTHAPIGLVTTIAASHHSVVWVNDIGRDRMALRMLPLAPPPGP